MQFLSGLGSSVAEGATTVGTTTAEASSALATTAGKAAQVASTTGQAVGTIGQTAGQIAQPIADVAKTSGSSSFLSNLGNWGNLGMDLAGGNAGDSLSSFSKLIGKDGPSPDTVKRLNAIKTPPQKKQERSGVQLEDMMAFLQNQ